jgi:Peptidase family M28
MAGINLETRWVPLSHFENANMIHRSVLAPKVGLSGLMLHLVVVLAIVLLVFSSLRHIEPPAAPAGDIGVAEFSAARAMQHVTQIARAPHPMGTEAHAQVREYLRAQITALGYTLQLQTGQAVKADKSAMGHVQNILVRVPGSQPGKALLLAAHYDSVPGSPGAADNGASVAAILETLRALKSGPPLRNDLIVLFSDGEEMGLLGATLFVEQHPWAKDVGVALNFEYRGNSGPIWMFETSERNGRLIREWQTALPHALGSSLLFEVYRLMPNDTDLSAFKPKVASMNFAAGEHYNAYHTALDNAQSLSIDTFQQQGSMMWAMTNHFGNVALGNMAADGAVYFDLPGLGVVTYSNAAAMVATGATLLLFIGVMVLARRAGQAQPARVGKAMGAVLGVCILLAAGCQLIWLALRQVHPGYQLLLHGSTYNDAWYLGAFAVLSGAAFAMLLNGLQKWFQPMELMLGALMLTMVMLVAASVGALGATFLFTWPALPILLALALLIGVPALAQYEPIRVLVLLVAAVPALVLFPPLIHLLFFALTPLVLAATILMACMLYCMITPTLLSVGQHRVLPRVAVAASLALFAGGSWTSGFDDHAPQPNHLMYVQAEAAGPAYLVSDDADLDVWTRQFFAQPPTKQTMTEVFGPNAKPVWAQAHAVLFPAAPKVEVRSDSSDGSVRRVQVAVRSARSSPRMLIQVDNAAVLQATVQGQDYTRKETANWRLDAYAMGEEPVVIDLAVKPGAPFALRVRDISYGLPPGTAARPANMISQPFRNSDTAQVVHITRFN